MLADPAGQTAGTLPASAQRIADYTISVRLLPEDHRIEGRERVVWRNPSTDTVNDLWFHLYLNAFRNNRSTFLAEWSGEPLEPSRDGSGPWGWMDITSIRLADGTDLSGSLQFQHPDDDNEHDRTVASVSLPVGVPPGGEVSLDIEFSGRLPRAIARTGFEGDSHMVAQWFPKLGVYEPAGMRGRTTGAWNCHQFHANTEFYADYGRYEVEITIPSRFVVGATGVRTAERDNGDGTVTLTFVQDDVHDFAWTADPDYVEVRRTFSAAEDVRPEEYATAAGLLGRSIDEVRLTDVELIFLMQPEHMDQLARHVRATKLSLKHFGLWYGRYPYRTLTVVDPGMAAAGGMEYPTLVTGGTHPILGRWPFDRVLLPEQVVVHEIGHQFWYGLVGTNEFEEAWLDEGITSYASARLLDLEYGRETSALAALDLRIGELEAARTQNNPGRLFDRILQPAWEYSSSYGFYSYQKPELALGTLELHLGEQTMARIMRTYSERWRFRHPSSEDFFQVASEIAGQDLAWFFDQTVKGTGVLDYEVASVTVTPVPDPDGVFDDGATPPAPARTMYESVVVVRRRGDVVFPQLLQLTFEGLPRLQVEWDGRNRWERWRFVRPERLLAANLDPDRKVLLDVDWLNNARRLEPDTRVAAKWAARWMFWMQNLIVFFGP